MQEFLKEILKISVNETNLNRANLQFKHLQHNMNLYFPKNN